MANPLSRYLGMQAGQMPAQQSNQGMTMGQSAGQGVNQQMLGSLANMVGMLNGSSNKAGAVQALASANPQMQGILQLCNGQDPKQVFINECKARGVDPDYALGVMAQVGIK